LTKNTIYALVPCANPDSITFAAFSSVLLWDAWLFVVLPTGEFQIRDILCKEFGMHEKWLVVVALDMTGERERER